MDGSMKELYYLLTQEILSKFEKAHQVIIGIIHML
jgi:predicted cupin superfamily sugar epimerase